MNLNKIIFYVYMNENVCNLKKIIKIIEKKENMEFEFKKIENQEMRNVDIIELIEKEKIMIK